MRELGEAIKVIFQKLSNFFDIFDLSFFVGGAATLAALFYWAQLAGQIEVAKLDTLHAAVIAVFGSYVTGLVAFAVGRLVRKVLLRHKLGSRSADNLPELVQAHGLRDKEPMKGYLDRGRADQLYTRLWVEVRESQDPKLEDSYALIKRYWVMAATCDGLATGLFIWFLLFFCRVNGWTLPEAPKPSLAYLLGVMFLVGTVVCTREASRFNDQQREELVATVAYLRDLQEHKEKNEREEREERSSPRGGHPGRAGGSRPAPTVEPAAAPEPPAPPPPPSAPPDPPTVDSPEGVA